MSPPLQGDQSSAGTRPCARLLRTGLAGGISDAAREVGISASCGPQPWGPESSAVGSRVGLSAEAGQRSG